VPFWIGPYVIVSENWLFLELFPFKLGPYVIVSSNWLFLELIPFGGPYWLLLELIPFGGPYVIVSEYWLFLELLELIPLELDYAPLEERDYATVMSEILLIFLSG